MSIGSRVFAAMYDRIMAGTEKAGVGAHRQRLLGQAKGDVLEVGAGTGVNLSYYGTLKSLTVTEPEPAMIKRLQRRVDEHAATQAMVLRAPAEDLPFGDDTFDTVVSTLALCTVDDQPRALREIRRVLRPGGQLLFLEHVRAADDKQARWQDRLNGMQRVIGSGCNCNRATADTLAAHGFTVREIEHGELPKAPPWIRPLVVGVAEVS